jgi:hypothetical protein
VHLASSLVSRARGGKVSRLQTYGTVLAFAAGAGMVLAGFRVYNTCLENPVTRWLRPYGVSVETPAGSVCYDHGPTLFGGWMPMELPLPGVQLTKEFIVPRNVPPARTQLAVALPLLAPAGGRLVVKAGLSGEHRSEGTLELKAAGDLQWFTLNLGRCNPLPDRVQVEMELRPDNGNTLLLLDTHRNYGRTRVQHPDGRMQTLAAESCAELILRDPATAQAPAGYR